MIRSDFLRSAILAPLAALLGCKTEAPVEVVTSGLVQTPEASPIYATAWTITTSANTTTSSSLWVSEPGGRWYRVEP